MTYFIFSLNWTLYINHILMFLRAVWTPGLGHQPDHIGGSLQPEGH